MLKREQSRTLREALQAELGDRCAWCSRTDSLQFDCIQPRGRDHHGKSQLDRLRFYERQLAAANLQLLCADCHEQKSIADALAIRASSNGKFAHDTLQAARTTIARGPEPSVSDWEAWCRWNRGEPAK